MADKRPDPLVGPDVDLRGYEFMPLYGDRLFNSETWIGGTPEAKLAALRLWWHAFAKEIPAGSLPDNDQFLAQYAGYGDQVKLWLKARPQAMRKWMLCNDGRLYHPVLSGIVADVWHLRANASAKGKAGAAKRWGKHRHPEPMAQASNNDGSGNTTANDFDAKERKGNKRVLGSSTSPTREQGIQNPLKKIKKDNENSIEVERNRRIADAVRSGDVDMAERIRAGTA